MKKIRTIKRHIYFCLKVGSGLKTKALLLFCFFVLKVSVLRRYSQRQFRVKLVGPNKKYLDIKIRIQDYFIAYEIFGEEVYKSFIGESLDKYSKILDLGAHIGLASLYFACQRPQFSIIALEPTRGSFSLLQYNTRNHKNIEIINGAVAAQDGEVKIYIIKNWQAGNSINKKDSLKNQEYEICRAYSLKHILSKYPGIEYIKFDIEGSELPVFLSVVLPKELKKIIGEIKTSSQKDLVDFTNLFSGDFKIKVDNQPCNMYLIEMWRDVE